MFRLSFTYRFEAAHRFTCTSSRKCMTPHGHTWRATLTLRATKRELNDNAMVAEFSEVKRGWKALLDETLDHSFFAHHQDPLLEAMRKEVPQLREVLFPSDPTTERLAQLLATKAQAMLSVLPDAVRDSVEVASVEVIETETNRVHFEVEAGQQLPAVVEGCEGWWGSPDPTRRDCQPQDAA